MDIRRVGVIGAGVMGAGIAAQVANAGLPVLLLDIVPPGAADRSAVAKGAVAKLLKTDPAPFMTPQAARLVEPGNVEDDLARLAECDWIIEVIVERLDAKQAFVSPAGGGAPARHGNLLQHLDHSVARPHRRHGRGVPAPTSSSPISSTRRATCGCWS